MLPSAEIARRRTFAIISHPDAGKTTLTEKFLLYGGAVHLAGSVTARKNQRASTSDWMELERKRGISISSTVLQFDYDGYRVNLLDTPGHEDFSEDTYRVLTAVDAVVMVIDGAKGIEAQTRKLFEVCRRREVPIFTFINKLDRPTREPLDLMDDLEKVLGIAACPMTWPLGTGTSFRGVYHRQTKEVHLFDRVGSAYRAPVTVTDLTDPTIARELDPVTHRTTLDELEMLDGAGAEFDLAQVHAGLMTPVYFGSATNNFGVQLLLDGFLDLAVPPQPRLSVSGTVVEPDRPAFSGFVFKIQANMDPRHRDRIAFIRICSGQFERDMTVTHVQSGKKVRLSNAHKLFGRDRETVDDACAGDIVGLVGHGGFGIGDTLTEDPSIVYREIPRFPPEVFVGLYNPNPSKFKPFRDGLDQLLQEGVVQAFYPILGTTPILAAVGPLQFEVVQARLESEYGAPSRLEPSTFNLVRWVAPETDPSAFVGLMLPGGSALARDTDGATVILFTSDWALNYFREKSPTIGLSEFPYTTEPAGAR